MPNQSNSPQTTEPTEPPQNTKLSEIVHKPKIIAISENRIRKNREPLSVINIPGYD